MLKLPVREINSVIETLRNDPVDSLIRKELPSSFLVGGYLRDLFLGRIANDRDYVVIGKLDIEAIKKIAQQLGGSFFIIKNLARIVLDGKEIDITFTDDSIERDLSKRDFTINSLAWSPERGIIDIYGGLRDLKKRIIRAISKENLSSDPLRILRAYRLSAEIKGSIEPVTRDILKELRVLIKRPPAERLTSELIKLLNLENTDRYLKMAIEDKIFQLILGVNNRNINYNFRFCKKLTYFYKKNMFYVSSNFDQDLNILGFLRLVWLSYKKGTWFLRLSKKNQRLINAFHRIIKRWSPEIFKDKKRLFEFFYEIKDLPEGLGFLFSDKRLLKEAQRFKKIMDKPLITGLDILKSCNIKSRQIGILLKKLLALQFSGKIKTKEDGFIELHRLKKKLK
ncbi:MAG: hypothetical protein N2257_08760 [Thermodesulfovibrionales bacterium]|nr:hypothetical protein [Thermodesulfovibrionales bacterium]